MEVAPFEALLDIREDKSGDPGDPGEFVRELSGVHSQIGGICGPHGGQNMKGALIAVGVVVLIVLILGGTLMGDRNDLVTEREAIKSSFAQVDNQMQRRADLIPNLVATVKGMASHEQSVIDSVTKARA
jgi:hypothetical protein